MYQFTKHIVLLLRCDFFSGRGRPMLYWNNARRGNQKTYCCVKLKYWVVSKILVDSLSNLCKKKHLHDGLRKADRIFRQMPHSAKTMDNLWPVSPRKIGPIDKLSRIWPRSGAKVRVVVCIFYTHNCGWRPISPLSR